ncbi:MAG: riboflavin biosynthesis protein RibF [Planctomycetota bacterium]|jgi:riboflavin kinase/FMN adenylyltransferase
MRVYRGVEGVELDNPVCTVGIFDGVHRGHRQLLYELGVWAQAIGGTPTVITFDKHPRAVLDGIEVPMILSLEHRLLELERHGVAAVLLIDFEKIKDFSAEEYLTGLRDRLGCTHLLLGFDSHLGKGRTGTPATLPAMGESLGIEVRVASPVRDNAGHKIGSSAIRHAIRAGDLEKAANVLGRPVCLRGEVVTGAGRGVSLGAATANLDVHGMVLPPDGVYLVRVFLGAETAPAIANLGVQPTFGPGAPRRLEVHIPGWKRDLYGQTMEVRMMRFLRPEKRFDGAQELKRQIARDLEELARAVEAGEI